MDVIRLAVLLLLLLPTCAYTQSISIEPEQPLQGSPLLVTLQLQQPVNRITATAFEKNIAFFPSPTDKKKWFALIGIDLAKDPGQYPLAITADKTHISTTITVAPADFRKSTLTVAPTFTRPNAAAQRQMALDSAAKKIVWASSATTPLWSGNFALPVHTEMFPNFGDKRVFNGSLASQHAGTDFRARPGTPIHAANSGRVALAHRMFAEGNCVILDHGNDLFTIYMHFSRFNVKEGQWVKKGDLIGWSGATGRVTGPHLHFALRWNGVYLNPASLLAMQLPPTK